MKIIGLIALKVLQRIVEVIGAVAHPQNSSGVNRIDGVTDMTVLPREEYRP